MSVRTLDVWCADEHAGVLTDGAQGLELAYTDAWHAGGHPPLSQSLPLDGSYDRVAVEAFFGGLLPEGAPREQLARNLGVSAGNDFELLAALGGDTAGAISLLAPALCPNRSAKTSSGSPIVIWWSCSTNCRVDRCTPIRTASTACHSRVRRTSCRSS